MTEKISLKQRLALNIYKGLIKDEIQEHPLRQLFWECTLRCNMRCRHCGSDCKTSGIHPDMPFEDFEKVLLRIREKYDPSHIMINISGGEPLVRKDLAECCRRIYELGFPWGMVSNGRLMSPEMIKRLLWAGMRSCTISLDGMEAEHNWMRGIPDAFIHAGSAIKILAGEPTILFDVVTCVNQKNFPQLEEIKEYLISLGVKAWRIFTVFPAGRAAKDPDLQISPQQYREVMDFIIRTRKEGRIHVNHACEGFLGPYEGKVRDNLYSCQAGLSVASVRVDGGISACTSIRGHFDQGSIYTDDFIDVWENRFQVFRDREWAHEGVCKDCKYWKWCLGNGMHLRDDNGALMHCNLRKLMSGLQDRS